MSDTENKNIEIKSVRRTAKLVTIKYKDRSNGRTDEIELKSDTKPKESFDNALGALQEDIIEICHFGKTYAKDLTVTGLTVSDRNGVPIACLVAKKKLPSTSSPFNIVTPNRPYDVHPDGDETPDDILKDATRERIEAVIAEAKDYVDGHRDGDQLGLEE